MRHEFGGEWTETKLAILAKYLRAYTTALKNQPFELLYIDAFAGTGTRSAKRAAPDLPLFDSENDAERVEFLDGSAMIALRTEPAFHRYFFIEQSESRCAELEGVARAFPNRKIEICHGDANEVVQELCRRNWNRSRGVLFLDPYGMQVDWATLEAVARTRAIDLWLLFPLGIGIQRLLTRDGDIPEAWQRALDRTLGTTEWRTELYSVDSQPGLFGPITQKQRAPTDVIGQYVLRRLKTLFAGVAPEPKVLRNSANNPLYLFCFAAANPKGARVALRIAGHLLL
jgi:three-Cys-motif partner protein